MNGIARSRTRQSLSLPLLAVAVLGGPVASAATCDIPQVVECRDVTPADFAAERPEARIIEAVLRVSIRFQGHEGSYVDEITIDVGDTPERLSLYAFSPETELTSEVAGDIHRTTTVENSRSLEAALGGELPLLTGDGVAHVTPSLNGGLGRRETTTEHASHRAPKHAVVVSGTTNQGRGVFFKLKRNSQNTLEGVHELTISYVAPADWQTGTIHVACRAHGRHKLFGLVDQPKVFGAAAAPVHLYLAGNDQAREVAYRRAEGGTRHECCRVGTPILRGLLEDPLATVKGSGE